MTAMSALARLRCWRVHDGQSLLALLHQLLDELASPHQVRSYTLKTHNGAFFFVVLLTHRWRWLVGWRQEGDYARNLRLVVVDCVASLLAPLLSSASLGTRTNDTRHTHAHDANVRAPGHSLVSGISRALRLLATRHNLVVLVRLLPRSFIPCRTQYEAGVVVWCAVCHV
jgi:hypothetical protein